MLLLAAPSKLVYLTLYIGLGEAWHIPAVALIPTDRPVLLVLAKPSAVLEVVHRTGLDGRRLSDDDISSMILLGSWALSCLNP